MDAAKNAGKTITDLEALVPWIDKLKQTLAHNKENEDVSEFLRVMAAEKAWLLSDRLVVDVSRAMLSKAKHQHYTCDEDFSVILKLDGLFSLVTQDAVITYYDGYGHVIDDPSDPLARRLKTVAMGIAEGLIKVQPAQRKPVYAKGKLKTKNAISTPRGFYLVSSHERDAHYRVLRAPRYYKDGKVPTDESQLRRVRVKHTKVTRHFEYQEIASHD